MKQLGKPLRETSFFFFSLSNEITLQIQDVWDFYILQNVSTVENIYRVYSLKDWGKDWRIWLIVKLRYGLDCVLQIFLNYRMALGMSRKRKFTFLSLLAQKEGKEASPFLCANTFILCAQTREIHIMGLWIHLSMNNFGLNQPPRKLIVKFPQDWKTGSS